jgi:D-psicose/D-tagatose/L-ribulose 3-epimerase
MITQTGNVLGIDVIPVLKKLGYDYCELSLSDLCTLNEREFGKLQSELEDIGLPVEASNNFFPAGVKLTGPMVNKDIIISYLDMAFQRASALGVKVIVFGSGLARMVPERFPVNEATSQLISLLRLINQYAQKLDIIIAIESLRKQECNIVNTYREAIILAETTNASNIRCLLDFFHLSEEKENISVILNDKKKLAHVHFAEPVGRVFPGPGNELKYRDFFMHLRNAGYDQRLSIEAYSGDYIPDAKIALKLLKGIENEVNQEL